MLVRHCTKESTRPITIHYQTSSFQVKPLATIRCSTCRLCDKNSSLILRIFGILFITQEGSIEMFFLTYYVASVRTEPLINFCEIQSLPFSSLFAKFCGSLGSKRETLIALRKILQTKVRKVWRKCGFFYAIWPILLCQMQSKTR